MMPPISLITLPYKALLSLFMRLGVRDFMEFCGLLCFVTASR